MLGGRHGAPSLRFQEFLIRHPPTPLPPAIHPRILRRVGRELLRTGPRQQDVARSHVAVNHPLSVGLRQRFQRPGRGEGHLESIDPQIGDFKVESGHD